MFKKERRIFHKLPLDITENESDCKHENLDGLNWNETDFVQVGPKKYKLLSSYKKYGLDIYNFEARPDDVYLMGFYRSGTTLHSEMVWLIGNDLNYEDARKNFIDYRFPHIDFSVLGTLDAIKSITADKKDASNEVKEIARKYEELALEGLAQRRCRRFIKAHLPVSLMPPHIFEVGAKVIYCARNPRDVIVSGYKSYFFFRKNADKTIFTFEKYCENFVNNKAWFSPYFEHIKEAWTKRNDNNFLFLFYEDTLKDMRSTIRKVADFLEKKLTDEQIEQLMDHLSFEKFKNNRSVNCEQLVKVGICSNDKEQFIRKGKTGSWRDYIAGDLEKQVNEWIEKNLEDSDLRFPEV